MGPGDLNFQQLVGDRPVLSPSSEPWFQSLQPQSEYFEGSSLEAWVGAGLTCCHHGIVDGIGAVVRLGPGDLNIHQPFSCCSMPGWDCFHGQSHNPSHCVHVVTCPWAASMPFDTGLFLLAVRWPALAICALNFCLGISMSTPLYFWAIKLS